MSDALFVDAASSVKPIENGPAFFRSTRPDTYFFANRAARLATQADGHYQLGVVQVRRKESVNGVEQEVVKGGSVQALLDLTPPAPQPAEWTAKLRELDATTPDGIAFRPLGLRDVAMTIGINPKWVEDPTTLTVNVGDATSIPIRIDLTPDGADQVWQALEQGHGLPIVVSIAGTYSARWPGAHYRITADAGKVHDAFALNVKAAASYFGLVGAKADIDVLHETLIASGAVVIDWKAKPVGFDESKIAELQKSILDSFAKMALSMMVEKVTTDPAVAPDPEGFFGGVSVALKSRHECVNLHLSGEYKENPVTEEKSGLAFNFNQLPNLDPDVYGTQVKGDNMAPISLTFGKNPATVANYVCQWGYVKEDGSIQGGRVTAAGADGILTTGVLQWEQGEQRPTETVFQIAVDWLDPSWEDYAEVVTKPNTAAGAGYTFQIVGALHTVTVLSDIELGAPGTYGALEWYTELPTRPDGTLPKNYSGSYLFRGKGEDGDLVERPIQFPVTVDGGTFTWEATLIRPDGSMLTRKAIEPIREARTIMLMQSTFKREDDAIVPRSLRGVLPATPAIVR